MKHTHYAHPGAVLKVDYLDEHGLSVKAAAEAMRLPRTRLNDIVRGKRGVTASTALHLAQFFGGSPIFWMNLQSHYDLAEAQAVSGKALKAICPVEQWAEK